MDLLQEVVQEVEDSLLEEAQVAENSLLEVNIDDFFLKFHGLCLERSKKGKNVLQYEIPSDGPRVGTEPERTG